MGRAALGVPDVASPDVRSNMLNMHHAALAVVAPWPGRLGLVLYRGWSLRMGLARRVPHAVASAADVSGCRFSPWTCRLARWRRRRGRPRIGSPQLPEPGTLHSFRPRSRQRRRPRHSRPVPMHQGAQGYDPMMFGRDTAMPGKSFCRCLPNLQLIPHMPCGSYLPIADD